MTDLGPWQNASCGAIAGAVTRIVISPLDVVKIRLQLQPIPNTTFMDYKYKTLFQTFRTVIQEEGAIGLFKGNMAAEYLYLTYGAIQFLSFYELSKLYNQSHLNNNFKSFTCGALSGAFATLVTYPFDLLRTRFAAQGNDRIYTSTLHAFKSIYSLEGIRGFYRGIFPSLLSIMPQMGIVFFAFNYISSSFVMARNYLGIERFKFSDDLVAGFTAGIISKALTMPLDVVRKRLQTQGPTRNKYILYIPKYSNGWVNTMRQIIKHEGILALFKGIVPSVLKAGIGSGVTFFVVENVRKAFNARK